MRKYLIALISIVFWAVFFNSANAQTQLDLEEKACAELKKADNELNKVYKKVLAEYKDEKLFLEKLKKAQKAWLAYRDAHVESIYPESDTALQYGSAYGMCRCKELAELTRQRTKILKQWSNGVEEGDVCVGSRKFQNQ
jgi:uncharacterized protein YecT (DUF1311 family)